MFSNTEQYPSYVHERYLLKKDVMDHNILRFVLTSEKGMKPLLKYTDVTQRFKDELLSEM
jgi:hypothetical protein